MNVFLTFGEKLMIQLKGRDFSSCLDYYHFLSSPYLVEHDDLATTRRGT